jgi:hypothetical protein
MVHVVETTRAAREEEGRRNADAAVQVMRSPGVTPVARLGMRSFTPAESLAELALERR